MEIWPGKAYPLGATFDGTGTNFALFSEVAERVELCLFEVGRARQAHRDAGRADRGRRLRLALLPAHGAARASATATACTGRGTPSNGLRCNPNKLLLDPYAKATAGEIDWDQSLFGYNFGDPDSRNDDDSAGAHDARRRDQPVLRLGGRPPRSTIPYNETVIYEAHVKGLTELHPDVPEELRGTYAGLAHPAITDHLTRLGRHRHRADAGAPVRAGQHPARQGPAQLLGLQHPRLPRPARGVRRHGR